MVGASWHELLTDVDYTALQNEITTSLANYALKTELSTGANVGAGQGQVFRDKTTNTLNFKTLTAGTGITIVNNADDITITNSAAITVPIESIQNVGGAAGVFKDVTGTTANFKSLAYLQALQTPSLSNSVLGR